MYYKLDFMQVDSDFTFYRYHIYTDAGSEVATVWFDQKIKNKNIYSISCALTGRKFDNLKLYFPIGSTSPYKPSTWIIDPTIKSVTPDTYHSTMTAFEMARNVAECVLDIFKQPIHLQEEL